MTLKRFAVSTFVLFIAGAIVRLMGFIYRVYLSNIIGAEGMGLYQLVTPIYSLIVLTLTSGVSITCSRMIAASYYSKDGKRNISNILLAGTLLSVFLGAVISSVMMMFSEQIAFGLLGDARTLLSIKLLIPCIPIVAIGASLKGFYYGIQKVGPTAISGIVEQITRVVIVFLCSEIVPKDNLEMLCGLAVGAAAVGEVTNFIVMLVVYPFYKEKKISKPTMRKRKIMVHMFTQSMPISINRFLTSCMSAVEMILIPQRLVVGGMTYTGAIELFGRMSGMVMPVLFFPSILTSALASTLVAEISSNLANENYKVVRNRISKCVGITMIVSYLFTYIFIKFGKQISMLIFNDPQIPELLFLFSFSCIFLYLHQILAGIMNGLGQQSATLIHAIIGYAVRILCVFFIVPEWQGAGYALGMAASLLILCVLDMRVVIKETNLFVDLRDWVIKPVFAIALVAVANHFATIFLQNSIYNPSNTFQMLVNLGAIVVVYCVILLILGVNELKLLVGMLFKPFQIKAKRK